MLTTTGGLRAPKSPRLLRTLPTHHHRTESESQTPLRCSSDPRPSPGLSWQSPISTPRTLFLPFRFECGEWSVTTNSRVNTGAEKSWPAVCLHRRSVVEPPVASRRRRLHKKSSSLSTHAGFFLSNASSRAPHHLVAVLSSLQLLHSANKQQAKPARNFTEDGSVNSVDSVKGVHGHEGCRRARGGRSRGMPLS